MLARNIWAARCDVAHFKHDMISHNRLVKFNDTFAKFAKLMDDEVRAKKKQKGIAGSKAAWAAFEAVREALKANRHTVMGRVDDAVQASISDMSVLYMDKFLELFPHVEF